jgi:hypothetical protein
MPMPYDMAITNNSSLLISDWATILRMGALLPFLSLVALVLTTIISWRTLPSISDGISVRLGFMMIVPIGTFLLYVTTPMSAGIVGGDPNLEFGFRYSFVFLAASAILVGLIGAESTRLQWALLILTIINVGIGAFFTSKLILVFTVVAASVVAVGLSKNPRRTTVGIGRRGSRKPKVLTYFRARPRGISNLFILAICFALFGFSVWREQVRYSSPVYGYLKDRNLGEAWQWIDQNAKRGDTIAFDSGEGRRKEWRVFPLMGAPISRSVLEIEEQSNAQEFQSLVLQEKPSFLVLSRIPSAAEFSQNLAFARSMPETFDEVLTKTSVVVFRIDLPRGEHPRVNGAL